MHLVDLALWALGFPAVDGAVAAQLLSDGYPLTPDHVEDYASAQFRLANGTVVRLTCSWRLHAGQDAVIEAAFYGTQGGAALRNVGGSFYDFTAERFTATAATTIATDAGDWGGRAAADWARRVAAGERFSEEAAQLVRVTEVLDAIYAAPSSSRA